MRTRLGILALAALSLGAAPPAPAASLGGTGDSIFAHAKAVWRARTEAPFVAYSLLERYQWRNRTHDNWWHALYRGSDRTLVLHRLIVAQQEDARLRGAAISINFRIHNGAARADTLETNANADAFPVLDPLVEPDASFGLVRHRSGPALVGSSGLAPVAGAVPAPPSATPLAVPSPAPGAASTEKPLRELARVEAVARDYRIALVGIERVRDADAYHLSLVPLRDPRLYRLRDLWIATSDYATLKLDVDGLFEGKPYDGVRWTVNYVEMDGRAYVQQIKTDETLHFGLDRPVAGLEYDFVEYAFPLNVSPLEFERLLPQGRG